MRKRCAERRDVRLHGIVHGGRDLPWHYLLSLTQNAASCRRASRGLRAMGRASAGKPRSRSIAIAQTASACGVRLEFCRMQSLRDTADPKLHTLDINLDESCVRSVSLARNIGVVGVLPKPADLGSALDQRGRPADQCDEGIVRVVLKDEYDIAGTTNVGCLARTTVGNESDVPVILVWAGQHTPHWPRVDTAVLGFGHHPAIPHTCHSLCTGCEQPPYFHTLALAFPPCHLLNL